MADEYTQEDYLRNREAAPASGMGPLTLVNEKPPSTDDDYTQDDYLRNRWSGFLESQTEKPILASIEAKRQAALQPKTWWQELKHGISRGVDQLQQTAAGTGMLASDIVGFNNLTEMFSDAVKQQDKDIAEAPGTTQEFEDVDSFDKLMRYSFGGLGEVSPNIAESFVTGFAGGIAGLVARKAARSLVMEGVETAVGKAIRDEVKDYAIGKITQAELTAPALKIVNDRTKTLAAKYGAQGGIAMSEWIQETGDIYNSMEGLPESERKWKAMAGGLAAALPGALMEGHVVAKFFPNQKAVSKAAVEEAKSYLSRFVNNFGKEIIKTVPAESLEEVYQTTIELAAKNWADPERRNNVFSFTDAEKSQYLDAAFKGALGGGFGGVISAIGDTKALPQHPNPKVRQFEKDISQKTEDLAPPIVETETDIRLSQIQEKRTEIEKGITPETLPEQRAAMEAQLADLDREENALLGEKQEEITPLVNEKPPEEATPVVSAVTPAVAPAVAPVATLPSAPAPAPIAATIPTPVVPVVEPAVTPEVKPTPVVTPKQTRLQQATTNLRALLAKEVPALRKRIKSYVVPEKAKAERRTKIETLVNEIAAKHDNPAEADAYRQQIMSAFSDDVLNMMEAEDIQVREDDSFYAFQEGDKPQQADIIIGIPSIKEAKRTALSEKVDNIDTFVAHEVIHAAHLVGIRDQWIKEGMPGATFNNFFYDRARSLGKSMRLAAPNLPVLAKHVYEMSKTQPKEPLGDFELGMEGMRMMVEMARTGKMTEVTQALLQAAKEEQASKGGKPGVISNFLAKWTDAIRTMYETLAKFIDPEKAPAGLLHAYAEIRRNFKATNEVLDRYGIFVHPETKQQKVTVGEDYTGEAAPPPPPPPPVKEKKAPKPKAEAKPKVEPQPEEKPEKPVKVKPKEAKAKEKAVKKVEKEKKTKKLAAKKISEAGVIVGPVVKAGDLEVQGEIGETHMDIKMAAAVNPELATHPEIGNLMDEGQHLFRDSFGNLLNREEAYQVALKNGQLNEAGLRKQNQENPQLESQDLIKPLVNENVPKMGVRKPEEGRPKMSKRDQKHLDVAVSAVTKSANEIVSGIQVKESREDKVRGEVPHADSNAQAMWYETRTHTESLAIAQSALSQNGGALNVGEGLLEDREGRFLNLPEDSLGDFGVNARLKAVYESTIAQLHAIHNQMRGKEAGTGIIGYIRSMSAELERTMRALGNTSGSYNAYTGMSEKLMTGEQWRQQYVDQLTAHAEKIIGKNAGEKMNTLVKQLNELLQKYAATAANSPAVIAVIRKIQELGTGSRFEKGYRETFMRDIKKVKSMTHKAAARAANHIAKQKDSVAYRNEAIKRIVREMTGKPKDADATPEEQVLYRVLGQMARTVGKELGAIVPSPTQKATDKVQAEMAIVLSNEAAYQEFIEKLREAYIREYGGITPSDAILAEAEYLYQSLANRMWQDDIVKSLVNEKMAELNVKFSDIVKRKEDQGGYNAGVAEMDQVRDEIREYMKEQGVENEGLIEDLVKDIYNEMRDRVEVARDKFFTSAKTVREFLRGMQTTLAKAAQEHGKYSNVLKEDFKQALINDYGFPDIPLGNIPSPAEAMANAMMESLSKLLVKERKSRIAAWVRGVLKTAPAKVQSKGDKVIAKILALTNTGGMTDEKVYRALQESFGLPAYSEDIAKQIQEMGNRIGEAPTDRQREEWTQKLSDLITQSKGFKTTDAYIAYMYFSMLSGVGTHFGNLGGNLTNLMGHVFLDSLKRPSRTPQILAALWNAAWGKAILEARESFFTGYRLGRQGEKFYQTVNPLEVAQPHFESKSFYSGVPALKKADEALARGVHKATRAVRGQYVGRLLMATDIFFYKIAEEAAYQARITDKEVVTPAMWDNALAQARSNMIAGGENPDLDGHTRRKHKILAHSIIEENRLVNENKQIAWQEAHNEARDATFSGEPKYWLGSLAKVLERWTADIPPAKAIIPFTRVAANITNLMLEFTPYGYALGVYLNLKSGQNPFLLFTGSGSEKSFHKGSDAYIRATMGVAATFVFMALAAGAEDDDPEDPWFAIYGNGPRDYNDRRLLQEKGWKPNSIKVGGAYFSYLYTPLAVAFSIMGRQWDDYRDGNLESPNELRLSAPIVAMIEAVKNQSFLASAADLMASVDSPDPIGKVEKVFARITSNAIPNIVKQVDKTYDPSIQQAQGFLEAFLKEVPIVRHTLKPSLNVFGKPVSRTPGLFPFPGIDRIGTLEKTDDPVLNMISGKGLRVPGFSKSTHIGDQKMTEEQFYDYVQMAGPRIYDRYQSEVMTLQDMSKEDAQDRLERISREEKEKARRELQELWNISSR